MPPALVDHRGQPFPTKAVLSEEIAKASMVGVRQAWSVESAVAGLTPDKLAAIIRQADQGDMDAYLTLAEEMEERDPHYGSVLQTRKLAFTSLERQVTWGPGDEDHPLADEIQKGCEKVVNAPAMDELLWHLGDSIAKGYAAAETIWNTTANVWEPGRYEWRDPRWFKFDRETGRVLQLRDTGSIDGLPLPPAKFVVQLAGRKSGLPARGGLARLVAFSFVCKLYGLKDWMAYAEIFGIPMRLGKYGAGARPEDVEVLKRAVFGLGSDASAVIPASMMIEFPDLGQATGGAELFHALVTWIDNQVSKAVLGQAGTTDMQKGGGYAQSKTLDGVRSDLTKADARWTAATVTRDVLTPYVRFNWGADAPVPSMVLVVDEPEDVDSLSQALERLVPLGLKVSQAQVMKKLKLSPPKEGEDLLEPAAAAAAEALGDPPTDPAANPKADPAAELRQAKDDLVAATALIRGQIALARVRPGVEMQIARREAIEGDLDALQLAELDGWDRNWGSEVGAVTEAVLGAGSYEDALARLSDMAGDLAAPVAARSLARAMFLAAAIGQTAIRRKGS
jgi:phage gp29-like protein